MILMIDNYDSFTYNLYQILAQYEEVKIFRNDKRKYIINKYNRFISGRN